MVGQTTGIYDGKWRLTNWYPNKDDSRVIKGEFDLRAYQDGNALILQSVPDETGSYVLVRLTIDDNVASGSWHATTDPHGEFKGAEYSGAGQLIISEDGKHMEGIWAGAGYDQKLRQMRIYTNKWAIDRIN